MNVHLERRESPAVRWIDMKINASVDYRAYLGRVQGFVSSDAR